MTVAQTSDERKEQVAKYRCANAALSWGSKAGRTSLLAMAMPTPAQCREEPAAASPGARRMPHRGG